MKEKAVFAFFYLDLDGFKLINDTYDHDAGDLILKEVSNRLSLNVGCSIGGAFYPLHGEDPMDIVKLADRYLYESKQQGKS